MYGRQYAFWVGVFAISGLLLFAVGLFLIGDRRLLFTEQQELETTLPTVGGLRVGTQVRLAGVNAGEVIRIDFPAQPSQPFVIRMRLRSDLAHLVRTDSVASVQTDGILGDAFVQLSQGSDSAPTLGPGGRVRGVQAVEFADVVAKASDTLTAFNDLVVNLSPQVTTTLAQLNETVADVNDMVGEVGGQLQNLTGAAVRSMETTNRVLDGVRDVVAGVQRGEGTIGKLLVDDALYGDMRAVSARAAESLDQVTATSRQVRDGVERLLQTGGTLDLLLADVGGAANATEEVVSDLAETTEALKRNFLVRGFFEDRGFFDIDALSPAEYRQFSAEAAEREVHRIWVEADVLFEAGAAGDDAPLTVEGRRRLDLAMGTFLDYRRDGVLVVEGYSAGDTTTVQLLRSDARARVVRDYLVSRFRRDSSITGAIGLGADARDSPNGTGRWDGVALTLVIPR
jgi:phospholipid/cholesterol/gamma-HCH transport system substrate-binding protein